MRMALRFIFPLLLVLGGIAWSATPLVSTLMERWFRADVEMRSKLVFHSIQESVTGLAAAKADRKIDALFKRITQDERLLALGLCSPDGQLSRRSAAWPKTLACPADTPADQAFTVEHLQDGPVLVASFALAIDDAVARREFLVQATHGFGQILNRKRALNTPFIHDDSAGR